MAESVAAGRQEVADARRAAESELGELGTAARSAIDIPTKVRRDPVRYGAIGAGAVFLALGGPKRVLKAVERRLFPRPRVQTLLPKEVNRTVDRLPEEDREQVRAHLERDFARYLEREHTREQPSGRRSFWGTYDTIVAILGAAAARALAKRFFEVPGNRGPAKHSPPPDEEGYTE